MGFHCGNTPSCKMCADRAVKYQLIQHRLLEPAGSDPDFTRGTLEGDIAPSDITFYRLQCDSEGALRAYIAQARFCRWPPAALAASACSPSRRWAVSTAMCWCRSTIPTTARWPLATTGKLLFEVFKYLGIADIAYNQPKSLPYPTENPWG